jgi:2-oxoisovalerate dehydrogenase E1 component
MSELKNKTTEINKISFEDFKKEVLNDYKIANESRETSLLGRREVLTGKAKFGIFGDGKEIAQIAMAKQFQNGDFRSGYYRDQTFMMAIGQLTIKQFFAGLYAHTDKNFEPFSAGRQMGGHFSTTSLNEDGTWKDLTQQKNSSPDISPTAGQMPRLLGLAYASKFYKNNPKLSHLTKFSVKGNEVAFGTIGDASTSEGPFWETINAAGVLQVPMVMSVWDDGHGISVPKKYQTTKESISDVLAGFQRNEHQLGYEIFKSKGWDYPHLIETYEKAVKIAREEHVPVFIHVEEVTQPQGHSTSGSHERYKSKERLNWEQEFDPIKKMKEWIVSSALATEEELTIIEENAKKTVRDAKKQAWEEYLSPIKNESNEAIQLLQNLLNASQNNKIQELIDNLKSIQEPGRREILSTLRKSLRYVVNNNSTEKQQIISWIEKAINENFDRYSGQLYSESDKSALNINGVKPIVNEQSPLVDGREILRDNFDYILSKYPEVLIFGEDSGKIGGVNQGLEGLQEKHSELRVFDTGIRECTIIGQGIGMAMRGLRPIAEIQYLDYLLYAVQVLSDDLATVRYRTKNQQMAPLIIRTRGHRLEGVWHSGSPMGMIINSLRGIYICVPRNMTQAAGFYNTLIASDDCALVVESLNGYRIKEKQPENIGEYKVPLGIPEIMKEGSDITLVCYGSMVRMVMEAAQQLEELGINAEVIDVQTLIPFDINQMIAQSVAKTNKVVFIDEDVPGGATAYMMQKVLEEQKVYFKLDAEPQTIAAKEHRPAYGSDGDYFSKPSIDDIIERVYAIMNEYNPQLYPPIY